MRESCLEHIHSCMLAMTVQEEECESFGTFAEGGAAGPSQMGQTLCTWNLAIIG